MKILDQKKYLMGAAVAAVGASLGGAQSASAATTPVTYNNWAGYQVASKQPQEVSASWAVPRAQWAGRDTKSTQWVGLGGGNSTQGSLLQAGTAADNTCVAAKNRVCSRAVSSYYAFVEVYPQRPLEKVTNLSVRPGDYVTSRVNYAAKSGMTTMTLTNHRTGASVVYQSYAPAPKGVAEAVVERTANLSGTSGALSKTTPVSFYNMKVKDANGVHTPKQMQNYRMTMANQNGVLANTSRLSPSGDSFTVSWNRAK